MENQSPGEAGAVGQVRRMVVPSGACGEITVREVFQRLKDPWTILNRIKGEEFQLVLHHTKLLAFGLFCIIARTAFGGCDSACESLEGHCVWGAPGPCTFLELDAYRRGPRRPCGMPCVRAGMSKGHFCRCFDHCRNKWQEDAAESKESSSTLGSVMQQVCQHCGGPHGAGDRFNGFVFAACGARVHRRCLWEHSRACEHCVQPEECQLCVHSPAETSEQSSYPRIPTRQGQCSRRCYICYRDLCMFRAGHASAGPTSHICSECYLEVPSPDDP